MKNLNWVEFKTEMGVLAAYSFDGNEYCLKIISKIPKIHYYSIFNQVSSYFDESIFPLLNTQLKNTTMEKIKVYESRDSEKIEMFLDPIQVSKQLYQLYCENLCNLYFNDSGEIVVETIWGDVYENVTN